ncbi:serine hydrolase [Gymnodinialimonas sp. 2305UL16-5]|uniref:serine hydrolase n=1 Tax=Gymnodinialimonas mytili TaxID=3126503 RepID=UPI0030A19375
MPYAHALRCVDQGQDNLSGTNVTWVQLTTGTPAQMTDQSCIVAGAPGTQTGLVPLEDALLTMMWESHNRTLDAVLDRYGPANITAEAQNLGLRQTEMYFGCPQPGCPQAPWADNISTLLDIARLFEEVESGNFLGPVAAFAFRDNMIQLDASGLS